MRTKNVWYEFNSNKPYKIFTPGKIDEFLGFVKIKDLKSLPDNEVMVEFKGGEKILMYCSNPGGYDFVLPNGGIFANSYLFPEDLKAQGMSLVRKYSKKKLVNGKIKFVL